jgi:Rrf2 family nitric oxide-sensitive transcriptional repressor
MQLTKFTDLSLRVLMYLTQEDRLLPVTINEIALQFDVPRNHLIKIVTRLNKLGWVDATRGRSGGLRLGAIANKLRLGDVLMELENSTALINCSVPPCSLKGQCHLKEILDIGLKSFYEHMNNFTLADIVNTKTKMAVINMHKQYQVILQEREVA